MCSRRRSHSRKQDAGSAAHGVSTTTCAALKLPPSSHDLMNNPAPRLLPLKGTRRKPFRTALLGRSALVRNMDEPKTQLPYACALLKGLCLPADWQSGVMSRCQQQVPDRQTCKDRLFSFSGVIFDVVGIKQHRGWGVDSEESRQRRDQHSITAAENDDRSLCLVSSKTCLDVTGTPVRNPRSSNTKGRRKKNSSAPRHARISCS